VERILALSLEHMQLSVIAVVLATAIGLPLGIITSRIRWLASLVMNITEVLQTIPSLAMLAFIMMLFGLGNTTLVIALVLYSLLPIVRNSYTAITRVDQGLIEAGIGMGMTRLQLLRQVQLPLALPVILAGVRVALVTAIGIATLGVLIGSGGLGGLIWMGMRNVETQKGVNMILSGAIPAALLAILCEVIVGKFENAVTPRRLKITTANQ
jgi:osmoprotectant transport system permease protein